MLNSEEFSPIVSSSEKKNYTSKRRNNRRKKTKRKSSSKKKSYSLPSFDNNTNYLDDIKKLLGGAKKLSVEEIMWFILIGVIAVIIALRHLLKDNKFVKDYISNWFDKKTENQVIDCKEDGPFMCYLKNLIDIISNEGKTEDKLYYVLTLILIVLFITELWMHMLRTLSNTENASHPKFCLLGFRCFM